MDCDCVPGPFCSGVCVPWWEPYFCSVVAQCSSPPSQCLVNTWSVPVRWETHENGSGWDLLLFFPLPAAQFIFDSNFLYNKWETAAAIILICTHSFCLISVQTYDDTFAKIQRALAIWSGFGMTLAGVQTCGDYMFSGHTVVITMLNFFVTECKYWYVCLPLTREYSKPHQNSKMKLTFCGIFTWLKGLYSYI